VAIAHHRAGRVEQAAATFREVLAKDPTNPDALHLLGGIAYQSGRPREAIGCYEQALLHRPSYAEAHYHLGLALEDLGRTEEAVGRYRSAVALKPGLTFAQYNLGVALKSQGKLDDATTCFQRVVELDPGNDLARFQLASLTRENPKAPPSRYIANLFDNHAPTFDEHLLGDLRYEVPESLVSAVRQRANACPGKWDVLDLGCGTGLLGIAIAPHAGHLVGVDLSGGMLAKARERNLYDRLVQMDLLSMMRLEAAASYDVIAAADVFAYLGDLDDVIGETARLLRPNGVVAFTVEAMEGRASGDGPADAPGDYRLDPNGRYAHSAAYLRRLAAANGFATSDLRPIEIRLEGGRPVHGWLAILRI
jgi:predicted TPR repeat methyltransferase